MVSQIITLNFSDANIGVIRIHAICHFTTRDMGYYPFYFQGYRILCSIFFTFRDMGYLEKLIMGIFVNFMGYLPVYLKGYLI